MSGEPDQVLWRGVRPVEGIRGVWPARNSPRIAKTGSQGGGGITLVYTVPTGKLLFISTCFLTSRLSADGAHWGALRIRDDEDAELVVLIFHWYNIAGQLATQVPYLPAYEVPAGYDVYVESSHGNLGCYGVFNGWLEDA